MNCTLKQLQDHKIKSNITSFNETSSHIGFDDNDQKQHYKLNQWNSMVPCSPTTYMNICVGQRTFCSLPLKILSIIPHKAKETSSICVSSDCV